MNNITNKPRKTSYADYCEHCHATVINPHNVTALSDENNMMKRRVKKAIAIKQRRSSVSSDELGLDLPPISNPILEIGNCVQPP